jgi:NADPH:quinone reductase-like Zn-dependent oxidoreductase
MTVMRAARLHEAPDGVRLQLDADVEVPECGPHEVLLAVKACGLNQVDLLTRDGQTPAPVPLPHTSGTEVAGEIVAVGDRVSGWSVGDRAVVDPVLHCGTCSECIRGNTNMCRHGRIFGVQTSGGYAEYATAPASQVVPLPTGLTYAEAAAVAVTGPTAWHMLHTRAGLRAGEDVLVIAAGSGIGSLAVQIARYSGARVIASAGGETKVKKAYELGADFVVDHSLPTWPDQVREFTGNRGVDIVFEHVGAATWQGSLKSLARGGRLVTSGGHSGFDVDINLWHLFVKEHTIIGSFAGSHADFLQVMELASRGVLKPVIQEVFPLIRVAEAQRLLEQRAVFGKLLLDPSAV